jgi:prophage regulatory protein
MQILRTRQVLDKLRVSRTTLWRLTQGGDFPKPIELSPGGAVGYVEAEIDAYLERRLKARDGQSQAA